MSNDKFKDFMDMRKKSMENNKYNEECRCITDLMVIKRFIFLLARLHIIHGDTFEASRKEVNKEIMKLV